MRHYLTLALSAVMFIYSPSVLQAYDASVFQGEARDAKLSDLYPRSDAADETYYSEEYAFTTEMEGKAKLELQFGFSNVLGDKGSAFVNVAWKVEGYKSERVRVTLPKDKWSFTKAPFAIKMDRVTFSGDMEELKLVAEGKRTSLEIGFYPLVPGFVPGSGRIQLGKEGFVDINVWPMLAIRAKVVDKKSKTGHHVNGWAILSHSTTTLPPQSQPGKWVQFRAKDPKKMLLAQVVQLPESYGGTYHGWFVAYENRKQVGRSATLKVTPVTNGTYGGKSIPVAFVLEDSEQKLAVGLKATKFKRVSDQLKKLPKIQRAIVAKYISPVSYQFDGEVEVQVSVGDYFALLPKVKSTKYKGFMKVDTIR